MTKSLKLNTKLLSCSALALAVSTIAISANAANMQSSPWHGFYAGAGIGMQKFESDYKTTARYYNNGSLMSINDVNNLGGTGVASFDGNDFNISAYGGYNFYTDSKWVVGIDADISYSKGKDRIENVASYGTMNAVGYITEYKYTEIETGLSGNINLKAGILAQPSTLFYGFIGGSFQEIDVSSGWKITNSGGETHNGSDSKTLSGYNIGAGVEKLFPNNIIGRIQYKYSHYGKEGFKPLKSNPSFNIAGFGADADIETSTHTINVGVAYKF